MLYSVKDTLCGARHWSHVHDATRSSRNIHVSGQLVKSCSKKTTRELWEWEVELRKRTLVMLIESSLCFWSLISVALCVFLSHLFKDTKPCESTQKQMHTHKCMLTHYTVTNTHLALISALISSTSPLLTISHYFTAFCSSHTLDLSIIYKEEPSLATASYM